MRRLFGNTDGAMAVYAVFITAVVIGAGVLALDFGKAAVLRSTMQNSADSLAMSGAKELDGQLGARDRARAVIYSDMRQGSNIQDTAGDFTVQEVIFYVRFDRLDPTPSGCVADGSGGDNSGCSTLIVDDAWAEGDLVASAVEVRLASEQVSMLLKPLIDLVSAGPGGASAFNVNARAVAERGDIACDIAPFFVCNPDETESLGMDLREPSQTGGRMMVVKNGAGNTTPSTPGNFGILCADIADDGTCTAFGSNEVKQLLISETTGLCSGAGGGVATKPGVSQGPVVTGVQTRFDKNPGGGSGPKTASNIMGQYKDPDVQDYDGGSTPDVPNKPMGDLPKPNQSVPMAPGDGWNVVRYWNVTHNGMDPAVDPVDTDTSNVPDFLLTDASSHNWYATRYQVYLYEKNRPFCRKDNETYYTGTSDLSGAPAGFTCHAGGAMDANMATENASYSYTLATTTDSQRRVFTIASVNCQALADAGVPIQGNTDQIPVGGGFIDFYLTESPCLTGSECMESGQSAHIRHARRNYGESTILDESGNIYAEVIGPSNAGAGAQNIITNIRLID